MEGRKVKKIIVILLLVMPFLQGCATISKLAGIAASGFAIYKVIEKNK